MRWTNSADFKSDKSEKWDCYTEGGGVVDLAIVLLGQGEASSKLGWAGWWYSRNTLVVLSLAELGRDFTEQLRDCYVPVLSLQYKVKGE